MSKVSSQERTQKKLYTFLAEQHEAFVLEEKERGETDLIQFHIDTDSAPPKKQLLCRTAFAVHQDVALQLRFCTDYQHLNSVTKVDTYPLPKIDDLHQLGTSQYLTLCQVIGKSQFTQTHERRQPLLPPVACLNFESCQLGCAMPLQHFNSRMECVLRQLNPEEGPDFVNAYIDDVLVFSQTLNEHLHHLSLLLNGIKKAGLKLKLSKCKFFPREVEFLRHFITTEGLKPNPTHTAAVMDFLSPQNINRVRQFVGLASYY